MPILAIAKSLPTLNFYQRIVDSNTEPIIFSKRAIRKWPMSRLKLMSSIVSSQYYYEVIRLLDIGRKYKFGVLDYSLSPQTLLPKERFLLKKGAKCS